MRPSAGATGCLPPIFPKRTRLTTSKWLSRASARRISGSTWRKNILTVSSVKEEKEEKKDEKAECNCHRREFGHSNFSRSFSLPEEVDKDGIKAEYNNGVLMITLPKKEEVIVKKEIQVV